MRRRRLSPYSRIEALRRSRQELLALVLLTAGLGIALSLLADLLGADLVAWVPSPLARYVVAGGLGLVLACCAVLLFHASSEGQWVPLQVQLPYHLPADGQPTVAQRRSYGVTTHARRAFMRHYRHNSPELDDWLARWRQARAAGVPFQQFIAPDNAALVQCLLLYVLHRYGDDSLGPEAAYGWWHVDLPAIRWTAADLPPVLRDNPFLQADQDLEQWRLWWPAGVRLDLQPGPSGPVWRLQHPRYGRVEVRTSPHLAVAGRGSQEWHVLTQRLKLDQRSRLFIVGTRLEARACFRWTFWPGSEAFHDWATGLLAYLEEALDWGYYLNTRTDRLVALLDQRIGWVPAGTSVFDKLQEMEGRLERLEVTAASGSERAEGEPPPGEALVV